MVTISHLVDFLRPRPVDAEQLAAEQARKNELIEKLARAIRARRLESPAVLFLELNRPIGFLMSQAALLFFVGGVVFFDPWVVQVNKQAS